VQPKSKLPAGSGEASESLFKLLSDAQHRLDEAFERLPAYAAPPLDEAAAAVLDQVATKLHDNYPYAHPLYAGQMLKPPHPIARAAYALAMSVNPNNHALDGGRASSAMEIEAVAALAEMFGWSQHLGHLTSGGTFANLEALWIAGQLAPGKTIIASEQAHYTHRRICSVLGLPFVSIPSDDTGRIDLHALDLRGSDRLGSQQQPREWHQLEPGRAVQIRDRLLGVGHHAGDIPRQCDLDTGDILWDEGVVLACAPVPRKRIDGRVCLPDLMDVPPSHRDPFPIRLLGKDNGVPFPRVILLVRGYLGKDPL